MSLNPHPASPSLLGLFLLSWKLTHIWLPAFYSTSMWERGRETVGDGGYELCCCWWWCGGVEVEEEEERHGWTRGDGRRKKKPRRQSFLAERWQSVWVCECVCVCVFSLFFFVISYSLDVADAQLGPITVYRLLMSSHFDKLLNLEWPSRCSNTHSPLSLPLAASTRLPPSLIPEPKVARSRWCLGLLRGFDHQKCTICIIASFNEERRLWNKNKPVKKGAIWAPYLLNLSENVLKS